MHCSSARSFFGLNLQLFKQADSSDGLKFKFLSRTKILDTLGQKQSVFFIKKKKESCGQGIDASGFMWEESNVNINLNPYRNRTQYATVASI